MQSMPKPYLRKSSGCLLPGRNHTRVSFLTDVCCSAPKRPYIFCCGFLTPFYISENLPYICWRCTSLCPGPPDYAPRPPETGILLSHLLKRLEKWFFDLVSAYEKWAKFQYQARQERNQSIAGLTFPFPYRKGQKELAAGVYRTINRKKNLFIQAPTGTGKTVTTVFPALMAVGQGLAGKIFQTHNCNHR